MENLHEHFSRWVTSLLPAALLGDSRAAEIVAHFACGTEPDTFDTHESECHDRIMDLLKFYEFLKKRGANPPTDKWPEFVLGCAAAIANSNKLSETRNDLMEAAYLASPSSAHFVETGVKEARLVSMTGRNKELRSAYAIIRSNDVFDKGEKIMSQPQKARYIISAAIKHVEQQRELMIKYGEQEHHKIRDQISDSLTNKHFKSERLGSGASSAKEQKQKAMPTKDLTSDKRIQKLATHWL
jgi:hypothetical protein